MAGGEGVRHMVLLKVANKENKEKVAGMLRVLAKGLSGVAIQSVTVVTDLGMKDTNADVAVIAEFPDKESYMAYATHPDHLKVIEQIQSMVAGRTAIQFASPKL